MAKKSTAEPILRFAFLDEHGHEVPDPSPLEIPSGFKRPDTLADQVARLVRSHRLAEAAAAAGAETFEESEDFEIDDDMFDPSSPYEEVFDPLLGRGITHDEWKRNEPIYRQRFLEAEQRAWRELDTSNALRARRREPETGSRARSPGNASQKAKNGPPDDDHEE